MFGLRYAFFEKLTCPKTERLVRLVGGRRGSTCPRPNAGARFAGLADILIFALPVSAEAFKTYIEKVLAPTLLLRDRKFEFGGHKPFQKNR